MASQNNNSGENPSQRLTKDVMSSLQIKEREGSATAQNLLKTFEYNADLINILENYNQSETQNLRIVELLYSCLTLNNQNLICDNLSEKLNIIISQLYEKNCEEIGELDMKIRLCFCILNLKRDISTNDTYHLYIIKKSVQRYPDNCQFYHVLLTVLSWKKEYVQGLSYATEALKKFPLNAELLYYRALMLKSIDNTTSCEIVKAFHDFLNFAPNDHRKVPEAHYNLSSVYLSDFLEDATEQNWQQMESSYESGLKAEENQLHCYRPYEDENKTVIGDILKSKDDLLKPEKLNAMTSSVLENKPYLDEPNRKLMIRNHRELLQKCVDLKDVGFSQQKQPKLQRVLKKISLLKPITLQEMNPKENNLFENRILQLLIIDDSILLSHCVNLITQDDNGIVSPLLVRNIEIETMHKFQAGCRVAIINPYMQCGAHHRITNDEPDCIVHLEKVNNMCRFCGEGNASQKCSKCKRPYCSKECQGLDWTELGHKLICSLKMVSTLITQEIGTQTVLN